MARELFEPPAGPAVVRCRCGLVVPGRLAVGTLCPWCAATCEACGRVELPGMGCACAHAEAIEAAVEAAIAREALRDEAARLRAAREEEIAAAWRRRGWNLGG